MVGSIVVTVLRAIISFRLSVVSRVIIGRPVEVLLRNGPEKKKNFCHYDPAAVVAVGDKPILIFIFHRIVRKY